MTYWTDLVTHQSSIWSYCPDVVQLLEVRRVGRVMSTPVKVGHRVRYSKAAVMKWIEGQIEVAQSGGKVDA